MNYGIGIVNISVYNPQANGICERLNRSLLERMRMLRMQRGEVQVQEMLKDAVDEYNRLAVHSKTTKTRTSSAKVC